MPPDASAPAGASATLTERRPLAASWRGEAILVPIAILAAMLLRLPNLGQPLIERHSFRQTHTAYNALIYHQSGIDLLHPKLPVLGPPFEAPLEFPLFQALASLVMDLGVPPDPAMRLTGIACFLATAFLLWGLVRRVAGAGPAIGALLFFLFSPFGIAWSRTSMIEYLATAGAVAWVWAGITWRDRRRAILWAAAAIGGSVAMLVKPTTALFWSLPLLAYRDAREAAGPRAWIRRRLDPALLLLLALPLAAGVAWTRHADAIKAANEATAWLTSARLVTWNFGTWGQRIDPAAWFRIGARLTLYVIGLPFLALLPFTAAAALRSRQGPFWMAVALAVFLPIATFFNLYWTHDYYLAAVSPAVAALLGLGASAMWERLRARFLPATLIAATLAAAAVAGATTTRYLRPCYARTGPDQLAEELAVASRPEDRVIIVGAEWAPVILYYARRWGQMVPTVLLDSPLLARLPKQDYRVLASADPDRDPIGILRGWPWIGVLGPRTYVMGRSPADLRGARVAASDDTAAFAAVAGKGRTLIERTLSLACREGGGLELPAGAAGTWIRFAEGEPRDARVRVAAGLAAVPARSVIVLSPAAAPQGAPIRLTCSGASSLEVEQVVEAPPPR